MEVWDPVPIVWKRNASICHALCLKIYHVWIILCSDWSYYISTSELAKHFYVRIPEPFCKRHISSQNIIKVQAWQYHQAQASKNDQYFEWTETLTCQEGTTCKNILSDDDFYHWSSHLVISILSCFLLYFFNNKITLEHFWP